MQVSLPEMAALALLARDKRVGNGSAAIRESATFAGNLGNSHWLCPCLSPNLQIRFCTGNFVANSIGNWFIFPVNGTILNDGVNSIPRTKMLWIMAVSVRSSTFGWVDYFVRIAWFIYNVFMLFHIMEFAYGDSEFSVPFFFPFENSSIY